MNEDDATGRTAQLVLELASGTAIVQGKHVELPLREFKLLTALARRPGETIDIPELIAAIWTQDAGWTTNKDLYVLVSKLRRLVDGPTKFGRNIRNRKGFGYILDLPRDQVEIVEALRAEEPAEPEAAPEAAAPPAQEVVAVLPELSPSPAASAETGAQLDESHPGSGWEHRALRVLGVAALVTGLLAASWSAGYLLSRSHATDSGPVEAEQTPDEQPEVAATPRDENERRKRHRDQRPSTRSHKADRRKDRTSHDTTPILAAPGPASDSSTGAPLGSSPSRETASAPRKPANGQSPPAPAQPPAPTHYLFHLFNRQTGDHFVTTDPSAASDHQAMGYTGGAIARVYSYQEEATKAISTNKGTAFIFMSSGPKTEPSSQVVPLWYSTNGSGDFFYTTSQSEAQREGWQGSLIGYARTM